MKNTIKIFGTKYDTANQYFYTKGELVFTFKKRILTQEDFDKVALVMLQDNPFYMEYNMIGETEIILTPVIVSETEKIHDDDGENKSSYTHLGDEFGAEITVGKDLRVVVFPDQISHKYQQMIVEGKLKNGSIVKIECIQKDLFSDTGASHWYEVKLDNETGCAILHKEHNFKELYSAALKKLDSLTDDQLENFVNN